jgi:hypothetical protein
VVPPIAPPKPHLPGSLDDLDELEPIVKQKRGLLIVTAVLLVITFGVLVWSGWTAERRRTSAGGTATAAVPAPAAPAGPAAGARPESTGVPPAVVNAATGRSVSAPLGTRRALRITMLTDTTRTTVRSADLGSRLFVITTSDDSAAPQVVDRASSLEVSLTRTGKPGTVSVDVQLNKAVRWQVGLTGAAAEHVVDMRAGGLTTLDLTGGASRIVLKLPRPDGTRPIAVTGGASALQMQTPPGTPVRVRLGAGATTTTLGAASRADVAAGTVLSTPGWAEAKDRYDVDATARIDAITVGGPAGRG